MGVQTVLSETCEMLQAPLHLIQLLPQPENKWAGHTVSHQTRYHRIHGNPALGSVTSAASLPVDLSELAR